MEETLSFTVRREDVGMDTDAPGGEAGDSDTARVTAKPGEHLGLSPHLAMFCFTQRMASSWSFIPMLPWMLVPGRAMNPRGPRR